jgi:hypothetical protein
LLMQCVIASQSQGEANGSDIQIRIRKGFCVNDRLLFCRRLFCFHLCQQ